MTSRWMLWLAPAGLRGGFKNWRRITKAASHNLSFSVALGVLGLRIVVQDVAASFLTRCCGSRIFVHVAAATSASCRGTSQQNIILQMFLQLQTLRCHASRPVAAGVSLSLQDVAASQYVCSCGAATLSSPVSSFGSGSSSTSCSRSWPLNSYVFRFANAEQ